MAKQYKATENYNKHDTDRISFVIKTFGYSKHGADYKKTSIDINDPMLFKCNYNYRNGDVYLINMKDPYAKSIVADAVNDLPLMYQNPDAYLSLGYSILIIATVVTLFISGLYAYGIEEYNIDTQLTDSIRACFYVIMPIAVLLFIVGIILFNITIGKYYIAMRRCASEICEHYYLVSKESAEKAEFDSIISSRFYLDTCPNCGFDPDGNVDHCPNCGSQMWQEFLD